MLQLDFNPTNDPNAPVLACLVGKGITFDSGGYSIKPSDGMSTMRTDMGGAALLTGALGFAIAHGLNQRVKLYLCCAENLVSGNAFKLGDIITYKNGVTAEILNTDAEGRLVLADGLIEADSQNPQFIVDCATLTGAAKVAVGNDYHSVLSMDDALVNSLFQAAKEENVTYKTPENAKEIAGHGSVITIDNSEILAGNKKLMAQYHVTGDYPETTSYGTEVFLAKDGVLIGAIVIADTLKDDAKSAIASLKAQNLHTVMLTGDSETTANAIAKETGIDEVYSRLLPDEKLAKLQEQRSKHGAVMFVGDGINDAPVLAGADCGAAMGSGADAAIEAADVVFMTSNVEAIPQAISIGKKACKIAWQNVVFALAIKALVMILGLLGFANMWMAVFADSGVAMLCVINSIRAMKL